MTTPPLQRLIQLLELSASDNDHEALAAIRKANSILKQQGMIWADVIGQISAERAFEAGFKAGYVQGKAAEHAENKIRWRQWVGGQPVEFATVMPDGSQKLDFRI